MEDIPGKDSVLMGLRSLAQQFHLLAVYHVFSIPFHFDIANIFTNNDEPLKYNGSIGFISNCQFLNNQGKNSPFTSFYNISSGLGAVVATNSTLQIEHSIFINNSYFLVDNSYLMGFSEYNTLTWDRDGFVTYYDEIAASDVVACGGSAVAAAYSNVTILNSSFYSNFAEDILQIITFQAFFD